MEDGQHRRRARIVQPKRNRAFRGDCEKRDDGSAEGRTDRPGAIFARAWRVISLPTPTIRAAINGDSGTSNTADIITS